MTADGPLSPDEKATAALVQLAAHAERLAAIERHLADSSEDSGGKPEGYRPREAPRWWLLAGTTYDDALRPVAAWVEQIYRPMYGHLAALLPACWAEHPICLMTLDWLSELWTVLYVRPPRTPGILASQAEWQTRLLPAAAEQMRQAAAGCEHRQAARR